MTEAEKLDRFVRGLKGQVRKEVELREPTTLNDAVRIADRVDAVTYYYGRQEQMGPKSESSGPTPMEVDAIQRRGLSKADREQLQKTGKCFQCREPGHIARHCPRRTRIVNEISVDIEESGKRRDPVAGSRDAVGSTKSPVDLTETEPRARDVNTITEQELDNTTEEENDVELLHYLGEIQGQAVEILIDGGSAGNFISQKVTDKLKIATDRCKSQIGRAHV